MTARSSSAPPSRVSQVRRDRRREEGLRRSQGRHRGPVQAHEGSPRRQGRQGSRLEPCSRLPMRDEYGWSANMERIMKAQGRPSPAGCTQATEADFAPLCLFLVYFACLLCLFEKKIGRYYNPPPQKNKTHNFQIYKKTFPP